VVAPTAARYEPATHDVQLVEPDSEAYEPGWHRAHAVMLSCPVRELKVPRGQAMQTEEEVAPTIVPYRPRAQPVQSDGPGSEL